ncbi:unnamed protein product [Owenia fusiformis]|uniref:Uncharacterized protein n=1 Tax=Owenia fusiformis TaxID=6347 RepID=A0A8J1UPX4_OWEFU|nr:unnamed protein product [Owenia fusiformis]
MSVGLLSMLMLAGLLQFDSGAENCCEDVLKIKEDVDFLATGLSGPKGQRGLQDVSVYTDETDPRGFTKENDAVGLKALWGPYRTTFGPWQEVRNQFLQFLDRHSIFCDTNEYLVSWRMQMERDRGRMIWKCFRIIIAK